MLFRSTGTMPANFLSYDVRPSSSVAYSGTDQTVGLATYGNLVLSGSGLKTFPTSIVVTGNTAIKGSAKASLTTGTVSSTSTLLLGTVPASSGIWASSAYPAADFRNDQWFDINTAGRLTVEASIPAGTWLGVTSTNWNATSNWAGGSLPVTGTNVVIPSFATFKPVISGLALPAECNNMTVNPGATMGIEPGQALTVNGELVNNGDIAIESSWVNSNGSLIVRGASSGTGTVSYRRFLREGDDTGDKHLLASPVGGQDISLFIGAFDSRIDSVRIWKEYEGVWDRVDDGLFLSGTG